MTTHPNVIIFKVTLLPIYFFFVFFSVKLEMLSQVGSMTQFVHMDFILPPLNLHIQQLKNGEKNTVYKDIYYFFPEINWSL